VYHELCEVLERYGLVVMESLRDISIFSCLVEVLELDMLSLKRKHELWEVEVWRDHPEALVYEVFGVTIGGP
jgi:hypothetical protein